MSTHSDPEELGKLKEKEAESRLKESETNLRTILDSVYDAVFIHNLDGTILDVNRKMLELYGVDREQALSSTTLDDFSAPGNPFGKVSEIWNKALEGQDQTFEWKAKRPNDGSVFDVEVFLHKITFQAREVILASVRDITTRKRAEEALKLTQFSVDHASVSAFLVDTEARLLYVNEEACSSLGYTCAELLEKKITDLDQNFPAPVWDEHWAQLKKEGSLHFETLYRKKDGSLLPVEVSANYVSFGGREYNWGFARDIRERKEVEKKIAGLNRQKELILESAGDGIFGMDSDGNHILVNSAGAQMLGFRPEELMGRYSHSLWHHTRADGSIYPRDECLIYKTGHDGISRHVSDEVFWRKDGTSIPVEYVTTPIREDDAIAGTVVSFRDITERKRMENEIRHLAHHDPLTGLPNRRLFNDIADVEMALAARNRKKLAILFLDLDRFKEINDTLGHHAGDQLLMEVAYNIKNSIRKSDTVARIGGDEFNLILADIQSTESISVIARKLTDSFKKPFEVSDHELYITTSIGISVYPDDGEDIDTLLRHADVAMYHAKENGRNNYQFYNPSINKRSIERMKMEGYLRQAIERNELVVFYQPLVDIASGEIVCAEALVRWDHPDEGLLEPKKFLPLAEESGLIISIDQWVLNSVCRQAGIWVDSGLSPVCLTVNLSARQFQSPVFVSNISSILDTTGMLPDFLNLEITESTAMSNIELTVSHLKVLTGMGIRISVDDFGIGCSSLNYLKKLPISKLKIDQSFIQDIATDPDDRAVITAVTSMARSMEIKTVAEGVETEEQLAFLRKTGCDEAQGFLFSRPVHAERFSELLTHRT